MQNRFLVFDMDGVLVDVSESYRETIQQTVHNFTGKSVTREEIQEWKNRFLTSQKGRSLADIQGRALLEAEEPKEV